MATMQQFPNSDVMYWIPLLLEKYSRKYKGRKMLIFHVNILSSKIRNQVHVEFWSYIHRSFQTYAPKENGRHSENNIIVVFALIYKHKHKSQLIKRISSRNLATKPQTSTNEIIKSPVQNTSTKFSKKKGTYEYLGYCLHWQRVKFPEPSPHVAQGVSWVVEPSKWKAISDIG